MGKLAVELTVDLDDGTTRTVVADQRDYARLEVQDFAESAGMHTRVRFLAFSAMTRQQMITCTWERFNTVDCVEVRVADDPLRMIDVDAPNADSVGLVCHAPGCGWAAAEEGGGLAGLVRQAQQHADGCKGKQEGEQGLDPGQPAASAGKPSTSRPARVSRSSKSSTGTRATSTP